MLQIKSLRLLKTSLTTALFAASCATAYASTQAIEGYLQNAYQATKARNFEQAHKLFDLALAESKQDRNKQGEATSLFGAALCYREEHQFAREETALKGAIDSTEGQSFSAMLLPKLYMQFGTCLADQYKLADAEIYFEKAQAAQARRGNTPYGDQELIDAAQANLYIKQGKYSEYIAREQMLYNKGKANGVGDDKLIVYLSGIAFAQANLGQASESSATCDKAFARLKSINQQNSIVQASVCNTAGFNELQRGNYKAAQEFLESGKRIAQDNNFASGAIYDAIARNLAKAYLRQNQPALALPLAKASLKDQLTYFDLDSPDCLRTQIEIASIEGKLGNQAQALVTAQECVNKLENKLGSQHANMAEMWLLLAELEMANSKTASAQSHYQKALTILSKAIGQDNDRYKMFVARQNDFGATSNSVATNRGASSGSSPSSLQITDQGGSSNTPVADKWALVIGVSKFTNPSINLKYPAKDARDFYDFLINKQHFAKDHVGLLLDEKATRENICAMIGDKWLPRVAAPDDLVLIYISSHGSASTMDVGGLNYVVAHNTDVDSLYATGIPLQQLTQMVKSRVHSNRVVIILDACHSGAASADSKGLSVSRNYDAEAIAQGTGQLVLCSSSPAEVSWESKQYNNGVFTKRLMEALAKNGEKTSLSDAYSSLKESVQNEVLRDRGILQTPVLKSSWNGNDLFIGANPTKPRPGLTIPLLMSTDTGAKSLPVAAKASGIKTNPKTLKAK